GEQLLVARHDVTTSRSGETGLGQLAREIGEDDVGAGPLHGGDVLEGDGRAVDPPPFGRGLDHRVLAGHAIGGGGEVEPPAHTGDDVEVGEGGLHHDHVRALVDVEGDLGQRLAAVVPVLLVPLSVAAAHDRDV